MEIQIIEKARVAYTAHTFPWHVHPNHHTLSLVTEGMAQLDFPGQMIQAAPGQLIYIPAGQAHRTVVSHSFAYQLIRFRLVGSFTTGYWWSKRKEEIELFSAWFDAYQPANAIVDAKPAWTSQLFHWGAAAKQAEDQAVQRCLAFMHRHYAQPLTLQDLSKAALRSKSHLLRTFKQQIGVSPLRYLLGLKVDRAKELILSKESLSEVAFATGFYDQSHFNRNFKRYTGLKPGQYRELVE